MSISLQISNLSKAYAKNLFEKVKLNVSGPEKIALIGDNGSGKSTFLKILAGKEVADTGTVAWHKNARIGYLEQEITDDLKTASGGEKKIVKIAQLFYENCDVLLLDEPDNHLDIENRIWFEELVEEFSGMIIVISHDRTFLRNAIQKTWLLEEEIIKEFPFGYDKFGEIYGEEIMSRQHLWEVQEKERKRLEKLVVSFQQRAASNKDLAKSYHSMVKRYDRFVLQMTKKPPETKLLNLSANLKKQPQRKTAVFLRDLRKSYGHKKVLNGINLHVFCGEKIAISAPNGAGKSTLLNIVGGHLKHDRGEMCLGPNLKIGFYAQERLEALNENETLIKELQKSVHLLWYDAIAYLKKFMFTEDEIASRVKYLSGGQKSRLQLAKFLGTNPDVLILDEPTNHLDLKTVVALEKFLLDYQGALILVSHDRDLVEKVTGKIYHLQDGKLVLE